MGEFILVPIFLYFVPFTLGRVCCILFFSVVYNVYHLNDNIYHFIHMNYMNPFIIDYNFYSRPLTFNIFHDKS